MLKSVLALALVAAVAMPAAAQMRGSGWAGRGMGRGGCMGPQFTADQQEQIQKIHEKYDAQRVELANRLGVLRGEMQDLVAAEGEPDFKAIEKKMEDMSDVRLQLSKLRLRIHQDIRPLLTDDQKKLFDSGLGFGMMRGMRGGFGGPGQMRHDAMGGRGTRGRGMTGRGRGCGMAVPMIGQTPGGPGARANNQGWVPGPYCPYQNAAPDDDMEEDD